MILRSYSPLRNDRISLYPKPVTKCLNLNKKQMYQKYSSQKKAEHDFVRLQTQLKQTEEMVARNPQLMTYYYGWIKQAQQTLKQYVSVIEAPDNVSFSV